jgi:hypothetical protein
MPLNKTGSVGFGEPHIPYYQPILPQCVMEGFWLLPFPRGTVIVAPIFENTKLLQSAVTAGSCIALQGSSFG